MDHKRLNVDLNSLPILRCKCGGMLWDQLLVLHYASPLISGDSRGGHVATPILICAKCGAPSSQAVTMGESEGGSNAGQGQT